MEVVKCPECREKIEVSEYTELGDIVYCEECDQGYEIVSLDPIKLKLERLEEDDEDLD